MQKIALVAGPCSARKSVAVVDPLRFDERTALIRPAGWIHALKSATSRTAARTLYTGRGPRLLSKWGQQHRIPVAIISAGLGLVADQTQVPSYEARAKELPAGRESDWWAYLRAHSPYSLAWADAGPGLILLALTEPYARMVSADLDAMPTALRDRVRLFGGSHLNRLPESLRAKVMPYDARLDRVHAGTRGDFAVRALLHFAQAAVSGTLPPSIGDQATWVREILGAPIEKASARLRLADNEIRALIEQHHLHLMPIARGIRRLRDDLSTACEMNRFQRLRSEAGT